MPSDDGEMLRQAVFGANDGLVSTFGLVAGLIGAQAPQVVLVVANVINMLAAGMSMGLGSYLASKSQVEYGRRLMDTELQAIRADPRREARELTKLCRRNGMSAVAARKLVSSLVSNEDEWLRFVAQEKHGLGASNFASPVKGGIVMFFVFVGVGVIPIVPLFFAQGMHALLISAVVTGTALFAVGAFKQRLTGRPWWSLGMENLAIGAITGFVGFVAGLVTARLLGATL